MTVIPPLPLTCITVNIPNMKKASAREEERDRNEAAAHLQAYVRGRGGEERMAGCHINLPVKIIVFIFLHQSKMKIVSEINACGCS